MRPEKTKRLPKRRIDQFREGARRVDSGIFGSQEYYAWQSLAVAPMTPELEVELRTTVASLRVKTSCQELLIMALLPTLGVEQKAAIRGCLDAMEEGEVVPSRLVDPGQVETDTARWIEMMRAGLDEGL